jgi:hypothetical protein
VVKLYCRPTKHTLCPVCKSPWCLPQPTDFLLGLNDEETLRRNEEVKANVDVKRCPPVESQLPVRFPGMCVMEFSEVAGLRTVTEQRCANGRDIFLYDGPEVIGIQPKRTRACLVDESKGLRGDCICQEALCHAIDEDDVEAGGGKNVTNRDILLALRQVYGKLHEELKEIRY